MTNFEVWKKNAIGRHIDIDKVYSGQCVDVIMDYAQYLFGKPWVQVIGHGNAKDIFWTASPSYFTKVVNNPHDPKQLPPKGAILCYGAFRGNPYGHVSVCDGGNYSGANNIEQDGFKPNGACYEKFRAYTALPIIGWLIPKTSLVATVVQAVKPKPPVPPVTYVVHPGDTLGAIAIKFKTTVAHLVAINGIKNPDLIKIGQVIKL